MNINNVPKRKKNQASSQLKRSQSDDILNKATKRKAPTKKLAEADSRSTLARSPSNAKLTKQSKKAVTKQKTTKVIKKKKVQQETKMKQNKDLTSSEYCAKTIKKFIKRKKQKEQELTQRKKIHQQYFMYRDVYLPIENTEQRKIIFKIQLIDENAQRHQPIVNQQDVKAYQPSTVLSTIQKEQPDKRDNHKQQLNVNLNKRELIDKATQPTDRKLQSTANADFQCQTEQEDNKIRKSFESMLETQQKCFAQTLSQLEFLFLPDDKNFEGFTRSQKMHYKQLLLYMAKKFEEPELILDEQTVQMALNQRFLKQRGMMQLSHKKGIPTHTPSIISYVTNLFCYIELHQKASLIQRINCTYGYFLEEKLKRVRENKPTIMSSQLIPESTFWRFETQLHQGLNFQSDTIEESLHAHNRAVFDSVNEVLLEFQPYYKTQGQPLPWGSTFETTFFCITQDSFSALANQIRQKLYQHSTTLAGIHLDNDSGSTSHRYKIHYSKILAAEHALVKSEIKNYDDKVGVEEERTRLMCDIADQIEFQIMKQVVLIMITPIERGL